MTAEEALYSSFFEDLREAPGIVHTYKEGTIVRTHPGFATHDYLYDI